jgi:hypothetical protein
LDESIWFPLLAGVTRILGSKNFRSLPRKDFCNSIGQKRTHAKSSCCPCSCRYVAARDMPSPDLVVTQADRRPSARNKIIWRRVCPKRGNREETIMKIGTIVLATVFAIASTASFAQTNNTAGGSSQAGGPAASKTTTGDSMNGGTTAGGGAVMKNGATGATTGSSRPSSKDPSTQGAGTAGAVEKKGDAASPGGTMKK